MDWLVIASGSLAVVEDALAHAVDTLSIDSPDLLPTAADVLPMAMGCSQQSPIWSALPPATKFARHLCRIERPKCDQGTPYLQTSTHDIYFRWLWAKLVVILVVSQPIQATFFIPACKSYQA